MQNFFRHFFYKQPAIMCDVIYYDGEGKMGQSILKKPVEKNNLEKSSEDIIGYNGQLEHIKNEIKAKQEILDKVIEDLWNEEKKQEVIELSRKLDELINEYFKLINKV